eukprot:365993-Chlamydomonas_euryale.AAC.3
MCGMFLSQLPPPVFGWCFPPATPPTAAYNQDFSAATASQKPPCLNHRPAATLPQPPPTKQLAPTTSQQPAASRHELTISVVS